MDSASLPSAAKKNIDFIVQIEKELNERRSRADDFGDSVAYFFGSWRFIIFHAVFIGVWLVWNSSPRSFDPYPFPLLGLVVGIEFILLTTFVLMNQKTQSRLQERWAHLNLQICLLTENEVTKNMQMLHRLCQHLNLPEPVQDRDAHELAQATPVTALAEEIDKTR